MGSFYKKALGFGALGAAAGAVAYYLKKQKEKETEKQKKVRWPGNDIRLPRPSEYMTDVTDPSPAFLSAG